MFPYWFIFALFAIGALRPQYDRTGRGSAGLVAAAIILTLFIGLRYEVGADWVGYFELFKYRRSFSFDRMMNSGGDLGFSALIWLVHRLNLEFWALNLACAILFVIGLVAFSRRTPNPWLSIAIAFPYLIIVVAMSGMRQATAIGFYFLALNAFSGRRLGTASFWLIVASLFHASAIIMLGVAALSFTRNIVKAALILFVTILVGYLVLKSSFDVYAARYSKEIQSSGTLFRLVMNLLPAIIFLRYKERFNLENHEKTLWRNLAFISILSFPLLFILPSSTVLDRFSLYLIPLQCFVLSGAALIFARRRGEARLVTGGVLAYLGTAMLVFLTLSATPEKWNNYQFYPLVDTKH